MRMEELSDSRYIKGTDTVERYLLGLVQAYFKDGNVAEPASREFIIRRAVTRMKEEFRYENIGVLSVTLADGVARTGPVNITLADLGAEPAITPKLSAFNVNFGDQANTACEGNDPRLSDARDPKPHTHKIQDINGLEGRLSTLISTINRVSGYSHTHVNFDVLDKIIYSGNSSTIDLNFIDTLVPDIQTKIDAVRNKISEVINKTIPDEIAKVSKRLDDTESNIKKAEQTVGATHKNYLDKAKEYTDSLIPSCIEKFDKDFDGYVTEAQLESVIVDALSYVGTMLSSADLMENQTPDSIAGYFYHSSPIPDDILNELSNRDVDLQDCLIDIFVRRKFYTSPNNSTYRYEWAKAPYVYMSEAGIIRGTLLAGVDYEQKRIWFSYKMDTQVDPETGKIPGLPSEVKNSVIQTKFYARRRVKTQ